MCTREEKSIVSIEEFTSLEIINDLPTFSKFPFSETEINKNYDHPLYSFFPPHTATDTHSFFPGDKKKAHTTFVLWSLSISKSNFCLSFHPLFPNGQPFSSAKFDSILTPIRKAFRKLPSFLFLTSPFIQNTDLFFSLIRENRDGERVLAPQGRIKA